MTSTSLTQSTTNEAQLGIRGCSIIKFNDSERRALRWSPLSQQKMVIIAKLQQFDTGDISDFLMQCIKAAKSSSPRSFDQEEDVESLFEAQPALLSPQLITNKQHCDLNMVRDACQVDRKYQQTTEVVLYGFIRAQCSIATERVPQDLLDLCVSYGALDEWDLSTWDSQWVHKEDYAILSKPDDSKIHSRYEFMHAHRTHVC